MTPTSNNVLRLSVPPRRHVHLRPEPARVIPLHPNRGVTERHPVLSTIALVVILVVLALTLHSGLAFIASRFLAPRWE